jgi:hypothetical protein
MQEAMRIDGSGRLGLGTSSPGTLLDVVGGVGRIRTGGKAGSNSYLKLESTDVSNSMELQFSNSTNANWQIQSVENGVAFRPLILNPFGGNVGIGTTSPAVALDTNGTIRSSAGVVQVNNATQFKNYEFLHSGTRTGYVSFDNTNNWIYTNAEAAGSQLLFGTANTERARIDSSGRLLVGTSTVAPVNTPKICTATSNIESSLSLAQYRNSATISADVDFIKSRSGTVGTTSAVSNFDTISQMRFYGAGDASTYVEAARITAVVDGGTVSATSLAGRLVFSTTASGASSPTERMRIRSDGNIGIGGAGTSEVSFRNQKPITGAAAAYANLTGATVQSDVTSVAYGNRSIIGTAAQAFTLANLDHFRASQGTFGAGSTVTNQTGFVADSGLVGATNNYGFYSNIPSAPGRWNFYANNTAPNFFNGDVRSTTVVTTRNVPTNSNVTATATAASLLDGLRTGTPTANIDLQLPTGTNMDAAFQELQISQAFEWSAINLATAASGFDITVTANTDHTVVGRMVVTGETSGRFLTRKTAANTFITYRIA